MYHEITRERKYKMDKFNYVIRTNEAVLMPTENNKVKNILKKCVWILVGIIILGSLIFQENLFVELSGVSKILLIILVAAFGFYGRKSIVHRQWSCNFMMII